VVSTDRKVAAQPGSKAATASKSKTPAPPRVAVPAAVMQRLFAAVAGGDTAAVFAVLQRHASSLQLDVSGEPSGQGLLPLHAASQAGHVAVAAALLDRGADPDAVALVSAEAATLCVSGYNPMHPSCNPTHPRASGRRCSSRWAQHVDVAPWGAPQRRSTPPPAPMGLRLARLAPGGAPRSGRGAVVPPRAQ
jgi:hypothetical protein